MAVADYNVTPSLNVTISGINVNTGCPAGNLDNAIRQLMADIKVEYNARLDPANYVPKTGGAFTGQITGNSAGGYHYSASSADSGGKWETIAFNGTVPSGLVVGDYVVELGA